MSGADDMPALPPDVEGLLEAERSIPGVAPDVHGRVLRAVETAAGGSAAGAAAGSTAGTGVGLAAAAGSGSLGGYVVVALTAFVLGGAAGAATYAALAPSQGPAPNRTAADPPAAGPSSPDPLPAPPPDEGRHATREGAGEAERHSEPESSGRERRESKSTEPETEEERSTTDSPRARGGGNTGQSTLRGERRVLDAASAALVRDHPREALRALERHESDFPDGQLVEERELMAIRALVALGRPGEARERAGRFHARFPDSLLGAAVRQALEPAPDDPDAASRRGGSSAARALD